MVLKQQQCCEFYIEQKRRNQLLVKPRHKILFSICSNNGSSDHMIHPSLLMSQFHVLVEAIKSLILTFLHIGCGQTRYAIDILNVWRCCQQSKQWIWVYQHSKVTNNIANAMPGHALRKVVFRFHQQIRVSLKTLTLTKICFSHRWNKTEFRFYTRTKCWRSRFLRSRVKWKQIIGLLINQGETFFLVLPKAFLYHILNIVIEFQIFDS